MCTFIANFKAIRQFTQQKLVDFIKSQQKDQAKRLLGALRDFQPFILKMDSEIENMKRKEAE